MKSNASLLPDISKNGAYFLLRGVLSVIFIAHGLARIYYWSIPDFGSFLDSKGLIMGEIIAWVITMGEIIGGILLMIGYQVRIVVLFNFIIIAAGIILVHFKNGWFVVGHGQGGIEYSLLILAVLLFLYSQGSKKLNFKQNTAYSKVINQESPKSIT